MYPKVGGILNVIQRLLLKQGSSRSPKLRNRPELGYQSLWKSPRVPEPQTSECLGFLYHYDLLLQIMAR